MKIIKFKLKKLTFGSGDAFFFRIRTFSASCCSLEILESFSVLAFDFLSFGTGGTVFSVFFFSVSLHNTLIPFVSRSIEETLTAEVVILLFSLFCFRSWFFCTGSVEPPETPVTGGRVRLRIFGDGFKSFWAMVGLESK